MYIFVKEGGMMNEFIWVKQLKEGNTKALEKIIFEYNSYVATIICAILHENLYQIDVQGLINQTFFLLWKNKEKIKLEKCESIKYYIGAIAKNLAINEKRKVKQLLPLDEYSIGEVEDSYSQVELREILMSALKELDKDCQVILLKFYFEGKKITQIAAEENMTESSVKNKLKRSREKLKLILEKGGFLYEN